jgi:hypothetical protein
VKAAIFFLIILFLVLGTAGYFLDLGARRRDGGDD